MNTRTFDGVTYNAGVFRGDDEMATKVIVREVGQQAVNMITMDPSGSEGPMVVKYTCDTTTSTGQHGFVVENQDGDNFFMVNNQGNTVVENNLVANKECTGSAFSKEDDHTQNPTKNTVVLRDGAKGVCNIANLRVTSRETNLNQDGEAPDGMLPGLFFTKGTSSQHLQLIDNASVFMQPEQDRTYRFGAHPAGEQAESSGIHLAGPTNEIISRLTYPMMVIEEKSDYDGVPDEAGGPGEEGPPLLLLKHAEKTFQALKCEGGVSIEGSVKIQGETVIDGTTVVENADFIELKSTGTLKLQANEHITVKAAEDKTLSTMLVFSKE